MAAIHTAMLGAMAEAALLGIGKLHHNKEQKFHFRGVEDAMNTMVGVLVRNRILCLPAYQDMTERDKPTKSGGSLEYVKVRGVFTFTSAEDGSSVVTEFYGEGCDVSDKAMTKAQSVAFRTALFQTFVIPTVSVDPEADSTEEAVDPVLAALLEQAFKAAETGIDGYQAFFTGLTKDQRRLIGDQHDEFKKIASEVQS